MVDMPVPEISMPPEFLRSITPEEWKYMLANDSCLSPEMRARLWRMTDRQGDPPPRLQFMVDGDALQRLFPRRTEK